jgi:hypothetical protein
MTQLCRKPSEYHTSEYGIIYNKTIASILEHTFGAKPKHRQEGNTFTFDLEELQRVGKSYGLKTSIQTKLATAEGNEGNEGNTEECTSKTVSENDNFKAEIKNDNTKIDLGEANTDNKDGPASQIPSAPSAPSALLSQVDNEVYFRSSLKSLIEKKGDIFKSSELQDFLVGTPAWTEATLFIQNALEAGEIAAVEGEYDVYKIVK